jgi:hypothetical protein
MTSRHIVRDSLVGALFVVLFASTERAFAQTPSESSQDSGRVWASVAGGISSRSYLTTFPIQSAGAVAVGIRWPIGATSLSVRVGAMAKTSVTQEGQYASLASMLFSLPSRRLHTPGLNPYALLGVGLYGGVPGTGAGGAHAGFGLQAGGRRYATMIEWARHSVFNVSQLTVGVSRKVR